MLKRLLKVWKRIPIDVSWKRAPNMRSISSSLMTQAPSTFLELGLIEDCSYVVQTCVHSVRVLVSMYIWPGNNTFVNLYLCYIYIYVNNRQYLNIVYRLANIDVGDGTQFTSVNPSTQRPSVASIFSETLRPGSSEHRWTRSRCQKPYRAVDLAALICQSHTCRPYQEIAGWPRDANLDPRGNNERLLQTNMLTYQRVRKLPTWLQPNDLVKPDAGALCLDDLSSSSTSIQPKPSWTLTRMCRPISRSVFPCVVMSTSVNLCVHVQYIFSFFLWNQVTR